MSKILVPHKLRSCLGSLDGPYERPSLINKCDNPSSARGPDPPPRCRTRSSRDGDTRSRNKLGRNTSGRCTPGSGIDVPREALRASIQRTRPLRRHVHANHPVMRRRYNVAGPNALWHHDGQHALISFGIVIHGSLTGTPTSLLGVFQDAIALYPVPSRVRGDRGGGGENVQVAAMMEAVRGLGRGSYLWGTHVLACLEKSVLNAWLHRFRHLEDEHGLNIELSRHVWLLEFLFLDDINKDLAWCQDSTEQAGNENNNMFGEEVRSHVDLHSQRSPFLNNPEGLEALQRRMTERWHASAVDRWLEGLRAMEQLIE
ncbi:BQ5605_C045g12183 [Microbotryum silenes-dioicae]|uniref:BQ5605_C045g12183 protein n=1 Tax=Microbotryum silenes-dioicae TaxID=796604 RepID=A0A2X0MT80_9BASI|nr:BQ5605_C045g12183 [Microbotryum silenes-dioicae]